MYTALCRTDERTLKVQSDWARPKAVAPPLAYRLPKSFQRKKSGIDRRRYGGWAIRSDTSFCQMLLNGRERRRAGLHHIVSSAAVHVDVDESRCENGIAEINVLGIAGHFNFRARA